MVENAAGHPPASSSTAPVTLGAPHAAGFRVGFAGPLGLALCYLRHYRLRSVLLVLCLGIVLVLPVATHLLLRRYKGTLMARARATPLVIGAKGSQIGLLLNTLYFRRESLDAIGAGLWRALLDEGRVLAVPIHNRLRAGGRPVVGTSLDYFDLRGLTVAQGHRPRILGDAVAGAAAARALALRPGGSLITDSQDLYDLAGTYPLRLRVTGILAPSGTADDEALFVDVKTAWLIAGIGHGHQALKTGDRARLLGAKGRNLMANASVTGYTEVTPDNLATFHFHGSPDTYPLTAVILDPRSDKDRTILLARYAEHDQAQILEPVAVLGNLMGLVFRIRMIFDAQFGLVLAAMGLLFGLIVALTIRLRRREVETLTKIGCARGTIAAMLAWEVIMIVAGGLVAGSAGAWLLAQVVLVLRLV